MSWIGRIYSVSQESLWSTHQFQYWKTSGIRCRDPAHPPNRKGIGTHCEKLRWLLKDHGHAARKVRSADNIFGLHNIYVMMECVPKSEHIRVPFPGIYIQYAPNCLEHRKCIKMDLKYPTNVLNCLHMLNYIFMVDLKSKNLHMGTHLGQNS